MGFMREPRMPTPAEALPGRQEKMPVLGTHFVHGIIDLSDGSFQHHFRRQSFDLGDNAMGRAGDDTPNAGAYGVIHDFLLSALWFAIS